MRFGIDDFYSDTYSDLYGGVAGTVYLYCEVAFDTDPAETPVWTDISSYVRSGSISRGRQRETDRYKAGTCSLTLDNRDRRFDPEYASSPYSPNVLPMKRIRLRVNYLGVDYDLFTGYVDGWPQSYLNPHDGYVDVTATDAFKVLAGVRLPSVWEQEVLADSPAHWWRLGESAEVIADAVHASSEYGVASGGPRTASGLIVNDDNGALSFDGVDDRIQLPANAAVSSSDMTVEAWIETETLPTVTAAIIYGQTPRNTLRIQLNTDGTASARRGASITATGTSVLTDGEPHHIVGVGTSTGVSLYVDGVLEDTDTGVPSSTSDGAYIGSPSDDAESSFEGTIDEVVTYASALSAARILAHYQAGAVPWADDLSSERVTKVLDALGWSSADRSISTGQSSLQSADLGSGALGHLQAVEDTEQGRLFVDASGRITFVDRLSLIVAPYTTSQATFGDGAGELRYNDIRLEYSDALIRNDIRAISDGQTPQVAEDTDSQDTYLVRSESLTSLTQDAEELRQLANWRLLHYKDPHLRVESIEIKPGRDETNLLPQVFGREIGDRVTVARRPQGVGSAIEVDVHVEGISHGFSAKDQSWVTSWDLGPAELLEFAVFDASGDQGEFDSSYFAF